MVDGAAGKEIMAFKAHTTAVVGLSFSGDGAKLKAVDSNRAVGVWDLATGQKVP